jgi:hypothetical protein
LQQLIHRATRVAGEVLTDVAVDARTAAEGGHELAVNIC